ncbi:MULTISPECIES: WbqC family protein [Nonlabens]|uniref:WbqC family protein n=1 Tax=Nonlabens TaxID=363408 RepID=UPI000A20B6A6|nr:MULTISPECIES: WbqC family protein [Nonlabens]ARN70970.1 hypothetical protein BST91_04555 [Nonlabens tegetincola]PQJ18626.1 hypothetical protein BST93_09095 [Nonlabens tegetincola]
MESRAQLIVHPSYFMDVISLINTYHCDELVFEIHDNYVKQTYRNRCVIATTNGKNALSIPIIHQKSGSSVPYSSIEIDYSEKWKLNHLRAIKSAYQNSPYYEYYEQDLLELYAKEESSLMKWNLSCTQFLLEQLQILPKISYTSNYQGDIKAQKLITAKGNKHPIYQSYIQVFQEKHGFLQPLSGLDLLFNLGPSSRSFLKSQAALCDFK